MDRSKKTLFELIGGIVTLTLIELAIVTILILCRIIETDNTMSIWLGGLFGMVIASAMSYHMSYVISRALDCGQSDAEALMRKGSLLRMSALFTIIVLSVCFFRKYINEYMLFLSIMNLKFAAYLVPLIDRKLTANSDISQEISKSE